MSYYVYIFIKFGLSMCIISTIFLGFYVVLIQKIACLYVRLNLLKEEGLFVAAYETKSVTIRDNDNGSIIFFPADWRALVRKCENGSS